MRIIEMSLNVIHIQTKRELTFVIVLGKNSIYVSIADRNGYLRQECRAFYYDDETGIVDAVQGCGPTILAAKKVWGIMKRIRTTNEMRV